MRKQILSYAITYQGEYHAIAQAIQKNERWHEIEYNGDYVTILDEHYPKKLFELEKPPFILFYSGDLSLLEEDLLCVIGSRQPSCLAQTHIQELMTHLNDRWTILSGLAKGVDGLAHEAALQHHRKTIGVIGCGLDIIYPKSNASLYQAIKNNGCIVSEYPNGCQPLAHHFPWRNRLLAALCRKCVVIEAKKKSGTLLTVNYANQLDRPIYVFPHRYEDDFAFGSNQLIQLGCSLILDKEDIQII